MEFTLIMVVWYGMVPYHQPSARPQHKRPAGDASFKKLALIRDTDNIDAKFVTLFEGYGTLFFTFVTLFCTFVTLFFEGEIEERCIIDYDLLIERLLHLSSHNFTYASSTARTSKICTQRDYSI